MKYRQKKLFYSFWLVLLFLIVANCSKTNSPAPKESTKSKKKASKSDFSVKTITSIGVDEAQTEAEEPYQISSITSADCDNQGNIYILDDKSNCVRVYDQSGKFLRKLFRRGQGPQEIVNAYEIQFNRFSNSFFLLNEHGYKLKQFDLMGNFQNEILLPRQIMDYFKFASKDILYYVSNCLYGKESYDNIIELDISKNKITNGFLHYFAKQRDDMFNTNQRFAILDNILWTCTNDTMGLNGIDLTTGKVVKKITIPGNFKKNSIFESTYQGQRVLGLLGYNVVQPLVLENSLFVLITFNEYDLNKKPNWKVVGNPTSYKMRLFKVMDDGKFEKIENFNQFDYYVLSCTYKNRMILTSYKPYPHFKIVEVKSRGN